MNNELKQAIKVIGNTRLHTYDGIGNIQSKAISESNEFKVIVKTINELETLKCDIARYFELLNKLYYRGETFTDDNNVEFAKLTQKLSKVGKE